MCQVLWLKTFCVTGNWLLCTNVSGLHKNLDIYIGWHFLNSLLYLFFLSNHKMIIWKVHWSWSWMQTMLMWKFLNTFPQFCPYFIVTNSWHTNSLWMALLCVFLICCTSYLTIPHLHWPSHYSLDWQAYWTLSFLVKSLHSSFKMLFWYLAFDAIALPYG